MKRNILARRAASAALAACMMFSLSAPALAASTDALLQQSTAAKSAGERAGRRERYDGRNGVSDESQERQHQSLYWGGSSSCSRWVSLSVSSGRKGWFFSVLFLSVLLDCDFGRT